MELLWNINPTDGRYPWHPSGARKVDHQYFLQQAISVDRLGFSGALIATSAYDVWVLASSLLHVTKRMRFLLAVHPGLISPTLLAKMAASFDEISEGRLLLNIVNGDDRRQASFGLNLSHDERYAMTDEYLTVWKRVVAGETVDFAGKYINVAKAKIDFPSRQKPYPPLWFGGSSQAALDIAAKHIDTYLSWGEPPPQTAEKIAAVTQLAKRYGRKVRFGIRLYLIVRETDEEAWDEVERLFSNMDRGSIDAAQEVLKPSDSVGQQRMISLHGGVKPQRARDLEIYPDMWAGMGLVRVGPGTAIVGSPKTVAARLREYTDLGIETFIVSGIPLLEEAYRVAELLLPLLPVQREDAGGRFTWYVPDTADGAPQQAAE